MENRNIKTKICLHDAAKLMATGDYSIHDAEVALAHAIEHGEIHGDIKRWATEQWEGRQLPGNMNRLETFIEAADFEQWRKGKSAA